MSWNKNNPAIRRIHADVRELARHPSDQYSARPLEENMFEWHFIIRGPKNTDFEGGVYHGRLILPPDYPFKPPAIIFFTPNGRWNVKEKICLSISSYHPEQWQPAWGIRTILEALISMMNTPGEGAVGAMDSTPEFRKQLARESLHYRHPSMPELPPLNNMEQNLEASVESERYQRQVAQLHEYNLGAEKEQLSSLPKDDMPEMIVVDSTSEGAVGTSDSSKNIVTSPTVPASESAPMNSHDATVRSEYSSLDSILENISVALVMIIFALLYRKALHLYA